MAKPNYQYEKRVKDLARKKKREEKRQRKLDKKNLRSKENVEELRVQSRSDRQTK